MKNFWNGFEKDAGWFSMTHKLHPESITAVTNNLRELIQKDVMQVVEQGLNKVKNETLKEVDKVVVGNINRFKTDVVDKGLGGVSKSFGDSLSANVKKMQQTLVRTGKTIKDIKKISLKDAIKGSIGIGIGMTAGGAITGTIIKKIKDKELERQKQEMQNQAMLPGFGRPRALTFKK